jgi:uncharacterized protein with GYD domain
MAVMTAEEAVEWGKTLDFPTVWAALMESRARAEEVAAESNARGAKLDARIGRMEARSDKRGARLDARIDETIKSIKQLGVRVDETTKSIKQLGVRVDETTKSIKQLGVRVDETTKNVDKMAAKVGWLSENVGGLNRSMGELIETLMAARLWEKFADYNYNFKRAYQRVPIYDDTDIVRSDIDILLSNTEWCMAVEVKREADEKDVDRHLERMLLVRQYPPKETIGKRLLGAIAGGLVQPDAREYAFKAGLYVFELTGEAVSLIKPPKGFTAHEW